MRKINEAAMKSYAQDVSGGADISARNVRDRATSSKAIDPIALPYYDEEEDGPSVSKHRSTAPAVTPVVETSLWCEAKTDEGYTYYWNVKTNGKKFF
jgi:WW domain-binding protein 4